MDYKEYSRLRSIARKRIERASSAGRMEYVRIPTVAEVRASANPQEYMNAVLNFLNTPGTTLRQARRENVQIQRLEFTPIPPTTKKKMSPEEKKARRREQNRRSKAKRYVEGLATNEKQRRYHVGYLRALESVAEKWREAGVDAGHWLGILPPKRAKQFVDYMEYRFSQGDYNIQYVIDTFIRDFGTLVQRGYTFADIEGDFGAFLDKQKALRKNRKNTNKYGYTEQEFGDLWHKFVDTVKEKKKDV